MSVGALITAIATGIFVLGAAVVGGLLEARKKRKLHSQTLTINMMEDVFWKDEKLLDKLARTMQIKDEDIGKYALPDETVPSEEWLENHCAIVELLNYFEVIATGVKRKIYDREIVEDLMKGLIIRVYRKTRSFIAAMRRQDQKEFGEGSMEFEKKASAA